VSKIPANAESAYLRYLIFQTAEDLEVLHRRGSFKRRAILLLRIPGIESNQRRRWEALLNTRFNACGCATGAAFALLAFVIVVIWQFRHGGWSITHWPAFALRAMLASMLGGAGGKTVGKAVSHWDLSRLARAIQRRAVSNRTGGPECQAARSG